MFGFWKKKNVLVLGSDGMLGHDLYRKLRKLSVGGAVGIVYGMDGGEMRNLGVPYRRHALGELFFPSSVRFDVCVNCMAMTDTKAAEETQEGRELSYKLNALAPKFVAESCAHWKVKLVHVSTDYVFDQDDSADQNMPRDYSDPNPRSIYGTHKLLGEQFVRNAYADAGMPNGYAVCRTSWLYGMHRSKSFVHKIIAAAVKAAAEGKDHLDVTSNERSVPTSTGFLCNFIIDRFVKEWRMGQVFHAVPHLPLGKGPCGVSRAEWAGAILKVFSGRGANDLSLGDVLGKISRDGFVRPVARPRSYYPPFSAMKPSAAVDGVAGCDCLDEASRFVYANRQKLLDFAERVLAG